MEPARLNLEDLDFDVTCDMQHPQPNMPGHPAIPCQRPAAYLAAVHTCATKRSNAGATVPVCQWYLEQMKARQYPYRCPGCNYDMTTMLQAVWDIQHLKPA